MNGVFVELKIAVCIKQILDPEMPPSKFNVDTTANKVIPPEGIPPVISPFDAQAVEAALRIKEKHGAEIVVVTVGEDRAVNAVKQALAMGADEGILIRQPVEGYDSFVIAYILTKALEKTGDCDLILCGRQGADYDSGQVGSIIAENLKIPVVTQAKGIDVDGAKLKVERVVSDGFEVFEVPLPAVVTVSDEIGEARIPTAWLIIGAAKKKIPSWTLDDLEIDMAQLEQTLPRLKLMKLFIPARARDCQIIEGETASAAAKNLAAKLKETGVIK